MGERPAMFRKFASQQGKTTEERMSKSLQGNNDSALRRVSLEDAVVLPDHAPETDDSPTVISKNKPTLESNSSSKNKITDLARKHTTPEEIVADLRGRRLAHFELIEPIGVGGMAAVIRARDTQLDRSVALKILPPEMAHETENIDRFHQEARAAAKLDHDNIARVFFCGEDQGLHFIAFEFVEGVNLRTLMERRGQIPVAEAVRYLLQVAAGLEHAATRGVVHRDVKPSNIIITPNGRAKLVDMGLARNLERQGERDLTQSGVTLGTFDYISPEQALEPREADTRSDIYSLGCTLYHMLTGHPPVPEGTPAKKLQHHQHHFPIDPRHYAPGIPDELVAIMSKMMAKNPKDRYQRPIQLVHHLMQVAKKVGIGDDLPESVLLVDTAMPAPPRGHPLLFVGLALAALVVITLVLTLLPTTPPSYTKRPSIPPGKDSNVLPVARDGPITKDKTDALPMIEVPTIISDRKDLQLVLDRATANTKPVSIEGAINLDSGVIFQGGKTKRLEIKTENAAENPTSFHYQTASSPFGILVEGGEHIVFRRMKFQISAETTPIQAVAAVALRGVKQATFEQCIFVQTKVPRLSPPRKQSKQVPLASLYIETPETAGYAKPIVHLNECYFEGSDDTGGQMAIAINGAATVHITNCAFKPHAGLIQFRKDCAADKTIVHLNRSAGYILHGPAFRFNMNASAMIRAKQNIFSRPDGSPLPDKGLPLPNLFFLADSSSPVQYLGEENLYHNLNAYIGSNNQDDFIAKEELFHKFLARYEGKDEGSKEISVSPWNTNGFGELTKEEHAFQLKAEFQGKYGLQKTWLNNKMPTPILVKKTPPADLPRTLIVDADDRSMTAGVFTKLAGAIGEARDGDTILIKHGENREVVMPHVALRPGVSLTLKPYDADHHPILVLDKTFKDKDTSLFKVQDSKLTIEQMEIRLDPQRIDSGSQSIVLMGETAICQFKRCVLTMRSDHEVRLNAVTFIDLDKMMKMETPSFSSARVEFHECFVRGKGDLVSLDGCRLLHVELKNSLVALEGSLLDVQAGGKAVPMSQGVRWKMERSSIYTTDSLFALRSPAGKGLTRTQAEVDGCLFWSLTPDKPVVAFHTITDEQLPTFLEWRGEQNFFANFDADNIREWKEQFKEMKSVYSTLKFSDSKDDLISKLSDATPEWFRPPLVEMERVTGFGVPVDIEKRMLPALDDQ
jgi:serine/threonine protein kinase